MMKKLERVTGIQEKHEAGPLIFPKTKTYKTITYPAVNYSLDLGIMYLDQ
jgi:hypothetical protein